MIMKEVTIHYCKEYKKIGTPVVVTDMKTKRERLTNKWSRILQDTSGQEWRISVVFNNSTGKAKRSGATTVLKVERVAN